MVRNRGDHIKKLVNLGAQLSIMNNFFKYIIEAELEKLCVKSCYLESEAGSKLRKQTARKTPQANEFARLMRIPIFWEKFPSW